MLMQRADVTEKETPNISRYVSAMRERPAYQRAMKQVGKTTTVG
jgi:glutathione S-transferase